MEGYGLDGGSRSIMEEGSRSSCFSMVWVGEDLQGGRMCMQISRGHISVGSTSLCTIFSTSDLVRS